MRLTFRELYNHKTFVAFKHTLSTDDRFERLNFNNTNRYYYVYRITDTINNIYYYGSRVSDIEPSNDLGIKYFSSSKIKNEIRNNINRFRFKILKIFNNNGDKVLYESFIHYYFDVKNNDNFFNEVNQTPFGFDNTGTTPWNKGYKLSESEKSKYYETDTNGNSVISNRVKNRLKTISSNEWKLSIGVKKSEKERLTKSKKDSSGLSIIDKAMIKKKNTYHENCERFNIMYEQDIIEGNIPRGDIKSIHQGLLKTTIDKPLGLSKMSATLLIKNNKAHMIGWYLIKL